MIQGECAAERRRDGQRGRARTRRALCSALVMTAVWALGVVPAWANEARIIAERQIDTRVIELTISTPAFTAPTKVDVDLPMGYNDDPNRRWPVTYYLAGDTHHYGDFNTEYDGERLLHSQRFTFPAPSVIRLIEYINIRARQRRSATKRTSILMRDRFRCQ